MPASLAVLGQLRSDAFHDSRVMVKLPERRRRIAVSVTPSMAGQVLYAAVAERIGWPADSFSLHRANNHAIFRAQSLAEQGCGPGDDLAVRLYDEGSACQIFVNTVTGQTRTFTISPQAPVEQLAYMIAEAEGATVQQMRLIHSSFQLESGRRLADYNIQSESTVHLVYRLRGGMFHPSSGRAGDFSSLTVAAGGEAERIAAARMRAVEIVLPDGTSVLLECAEDDDNDRILDRLRQRLRQQAAEDVLAADVDSIQDTEQLQRMMRQAQAALAGGNA